MQELKRLTTCIIGCVGFQCANRNVQKLCSIRTYTHACIHAYVHAHMNTCTFKATKDIAAGQEIFVYYGNASWFKDKHISPIDVDYASTRWRPDLQPLPCDQSVLQQIDPDGRRSYTVLTALQSGTVVGISVCIEVPVTVLDQFPVLRDFVLTGQTGNLHTGVANNAALPHTNTPPVLLQTPADNLNGYGTVFHLSAHALPILKPITIQKRSTPFAWTRNTNASITRVSIVGRMLHSNALARISTLTVILLTTL